MPLIVVLDDRITNRNIFSKLASTIDADVAVQAFGDPLEALVWLRDNTPDLIITDYKMPHLDGAEFIRRFREIPRSSDIPVVVISVYEERSFRLRALEAGATDFLNSPVDHHEFVTRARNLLKLRQQQLELEARADVLERKLEDSEKTRAHDLRDSRERLAQVIDTVPVMISAASAEGRILFINRHQVAFMGVDPDTVIDAPLTALFGDDNGARNRALDRVVLDSGAALPPYEEEITGKDGEKRVFLTTKAPLRDASNVITGVLTSSQDITARKQTEAHLRRLAHHDTLTDLPNRNLLVERMRRHIARARRGDALFALHIVNIDGFKAINDRYGHSGGDRFIRMVAAKLKDSMREQDTLARIAGDEFAILQTRVAGADDAAEFAERVLEIVRGCVAFEDGAARTSASAGVALHPHDGVDAEELLKNAAFALYRAKVEKRGSFGFYAADLHARARREAALDGELTRALENSEFLLYYQPQIDFGSGAIIGAEALLRWRRPGAGIVAPGAFLGRAEETGLIIPINEWVLREACAEARAWRMPTGRPMHVSVNLSPIQFEKQNVPLLVARVLADTGLDARRLDLEITEGILLKDFDAAAADLRKLMDLGVCISIDDFGAGYSSLNYIKRLPVKRLKIDQSFVRNLQTDPSDAAIVRAMITLGHSLGLQVLAEGVETAEHAATLRAEGCNEAQGYYFGRPMPAVDFRRLIGCDEIGQGESKSVAGRVLRG